MVMNQDIAEGATKKTEGKIEEAYGVLTDSDEHRAVGKAKQVEGTTQEGVGHIKEAIADAVKRNHIESK